jgi:di/tricarboxylate transporter
MTDAAITLTILAIAVAVFVWNRLPVGVVAVLTALSLAASGVIGVDTALAGFGDPVVLFIATLFIVSEGVDSSGLTGWAGQILVRRLGDRPALLVTGLLVLVAVLAALVTPNGAVAALIPLAVLLAGRIGEAPSRLLMPLAFTGSAGALLALTGSPVNVIVSDAARDEGGDGFGFFEFAIVGVPLVAVTVLLSAWLGPRVLPARVAASLPPDLSTYASTVSRHYDLREGFARLRVREGSPLVGLRPGEVHLTDYPGLVLIGMQAANDVPVPVQRIVEPDDVLVVTGPADELTRAVVELGLTIGMRSVGGVGGDRLVTRDTGVVELVVPPRSELVGMQAFAGMTVGPDLLVLAIRRRGEDVGARTVTVREGDAILAYGTWEAVDALADEREVLVVNSPDLLRRQAAPLGPVAYRAAGVLIGMIVLLASGLVVPAVAGLLAASAMILLRVVGVEQAYRSVSWQTVVLIGGLIPLSAAISASGAADLVADLIVGAVGDGRPILLLLAIFGLTVALGQVVSNTATVLVVVPIAVAAAVETGVAVEPVLMLVAVAGAASLLTPIATPANTMVMAPGDYAFGDYWRLGLPVLIAWLVVALAVIPLVWPL